MRGSTGSATVPHQPWCSSTAAGGARAIPGPTTGRPAIAGCEADARGTGQLPSGGASAEGFWLAGAGMGCLAGPFLADRRHAADWRVSPLRAASLSGVAPAIVTPAWFDPLRDEGTAYA